MKKIIILFMILTFNAYGEIGLILLPEYNFYEDLAIDKDEINLTYSRDEKIPAYSIIFYKEVYDFFQFGLALGKQESFLGDYFEEENNYVENIPVSFFLRMKVQASNNTIFYYSSVIGYPILDTEELIVHEDYKSTYGETAIIKGRFHSGFSFGYEFHFLLLEIGMKYTEFAIEPSNTNESTHSYVNSRFFASLGLKF